MWIFLFDFSITFLSYNPMWILIYFYIRFFPLNFGLLSMKFNEFLTFHFLSRGWINWTLLHYMGYILWFIQLLNNFFRLQKKDKSKKRRTQFLLKDFYDIKSFKSFFFIFIKFGPAYNWFILRILIVKIKALWFLSMKFTAFLTFLFPSNFELKFIDLFLCDFLYLIFPLNFYPTTNSNFALLLCTVSVLNFWTLTDEIQCVFNFSFSLELLK